jgi:hypothetical protein
MEVWLNLTAVNNQFRVASMIASPVHDYFTLLGQGVGSLEGLSRRYNYRTDLLLELLYSSMSDLLTKRPLMRGLLSASFFLQSYLMRLRQILIFRLAWKRAMRALRASGR